MTRYDPNVFCFGWAVKTSVWLQPAKIMSPVSERRKYTLSLTDPFSWPERNLAGNAIDFFMRVLGLSFHDAMCQITSEPLAIKARSSA